MVAWFDVWAATEAINAICVRSWRRKGVAAYLVLACSQQHSFINLFSSSHNHPPSPIMNPDASATIKATYTKRSSTYESASQSSFHFCQAQEYIQRANLQPGQSVLDLACGTGLVTIPAKQYVGPTGRVVGIDFSDGMLDVARRKTSEQGLDIRYIEHDIRYIEHDITDLAPLELDKFDVITCASALLLMPDPRYAVKHWSSLLVPGGRLLTDVVLERSLVAHTILTHIGPEVGRALLWDSSWVENENSLKELFIDAGLVVEEVYESDGYETREYRVEDGAEVFEQSMFRKLGDLEIREEAKELFVERFREMAGQDGVVREEVRFYMGIARKEL
ncbi:MAG: hypothetical protein Q9204_001997 [Flavoplaca sp. TL-2023a]